MVLLLFLFSKVQIQHSADIFHQIPRKVFFGTGDFFQPCDDSASKGQSFLFLAILI